ncbi:MAG: hypothetical protein WDW38_003464 [Sanguina aurantia]
MAKRALQILDLSSHQDALSKQDCVMFLVAMGQNPTIVIMDEKLLALGPKTEYTFDELLRIWHSLMTDAALENQALLLRAFQYFDKDGNGEVSVSEMRVCMEQLGSLMSPSDFEGFLTAMDLTNDGVIPYLEFLQLLYDQANQVSGEAGAAGCTARSGRLRKVIFWHRRNGQRDSLPAERSLHQLVLESYGPQEEEEEADASAGPDILQLAEVGGMRATSRSTTRPGPSTTAAAAAATTATATAVSIAPARISKVTTAPPVKAASVPNKAPAPSVVKAPLSWFPMLSVYHPIKQPVKVDQPEIPADQPGSVDQTGSAATESTHAAQPVVTLPDAGSLAEQPAEGHSERASSHPAHAVMVASEAAKAHIGARIDWFLNLPAAHAEKQLQKRAATAAATERPVSTIDATEEAGMGVPSASGIVSVVATEAAGGESAASRMESVAEEPEAAAAAAGSQPAVTDVKVCEIRSFLAAEETGTARDLRGKVQQPGDGTGQPQLVSTEQQPARLSLETSAVDIVGHTAPPLPTPLAHSLPGQQPSMGPGQQPGPPSIDIPAVGSRGHTSHSRPSPKAYVPPKVVFNPHHISHTLSSSNKVAAARTSPNRDRTSPGRAVARALMLNTVSRQPTPQNPTPTTTFTTTSQPAAASQQYPPSCSTPSGSDTLPRGGSVDQGVGGGSEEVQSGSQARGTKKAPTAICISEPDLNFLQDEASAGHQVPGQPAEGHSSVDRPARIRKCRVWLRRHS